MKLGIFEEDGTLVKKWEVPTRKEENGKYILGDIAASIRRTAKESGLELSDFSGAGMGFPGPVLPDGHCEVCVNLGWKAGNPQQELSRLLDGMVVKSGNDANVAALGEMWQLNSDFIFKSRLGPEFKGRLSPTFSREKVFIQFRSACGRPQSARTGPP